MYKVASQLSKADPSNQGLKDLIEQAKAGKQLAFDQIAYVMETRSLKKNRDRIGLASVKKLSALLFKGYDILCNEVADNVFEFVKRIDRIKVVKKFFIQITGFTCNGFHFCICSCSSSTNLSIQYTPYMFYLLIGQVEQRVYFAL